MKIPAIMDIIIATERDDHVVSAQLEPTAPTLDSTITCPECGATTRERKSTDVCQFFWNCPVCGALLKPKQRELLRILLLR